MSVRPASSVDPGVVGAWRLNDGAGQTVVGAAGGNGFLGSVMAVDVNDPMWVTPP